MTPPSPPHPSPDDVNKELLEEVRQLRAEQARTRKAAEKSNKFSLGRVLALLLLILLLPIAAIMILGGLADLLGGG